MKNLNYTQKNQRDQEFNTIWEKFGKASFFLKKLKH